MDLIFMGITDIVIVLFILSFFIIGAKKGIAKKILNIASGLIGLILALIFASKFANMLIANEILYPGIYENIYTNITETQAFNNPDASLDMFLTELGLPNFVSNFIANSTDLTPVVIAQTIASSLGTMLMTILSFLILFFGIWILAKILKVIIEILRNNVSFIKIVDGILGFITYGAFGFIVLYILLFILSLLFQIPALEPFRDFMIVDMQLQTDKFRLSKWFYENNLLLNIFRLFF